MIIENAGLDSPIIINKLLNKKDARYGFDANREKYVDMIDAGVIDPLKVVRIAL